MYRSIRPRHLVTVFICAAVAALARALVYKHVWGS
jgi:hypothetical protein